MTMRHRLRSGSARRGFATITSAALLLSMMAVPATAEHFENTDVLDADNAVEAGVNWSEFTFDSATDVALGRNDKFPDNLASAVIQGTDTPLLYTDSDALSEETAAELDRLGAETVHVLGGDEAISEDVVDELEDLGYETHRDSGETRIETAIDIASKHADDATHALIVRAFGDAGGDETRAWADSLAAGGWAAEEGWPVLLTQTEELNDNVAAYIEDSAIESATIIGGVNAVSAAVASDLEALGVEVDRVSGVNRFATAVAIAAERGFADAGDADSVILSEGQQSDAWAGGFAAAAYSAISGAPIVLSNGETIPPETEEFLSGSTDGSVALVCGPFVEPEACDEAATILGQEEAAHTNESFTVTPAGDQAEETDTEIEFTVTGISAESVDIALVPCEDITVEDGVVSFDDTDNNNLADNVGNTNATISTVDGTAAGTDYRNNVDPDAGEDNEITFEVTAAQDECVVAVVFADADNDDQLDLDANDQPTEAFAVTGALQYTPAEADFGTYTNTVVARADTEDNLFVTDSDGTFLYGAEDEFFLGAQEITLGQFEGLLSVDDIIDVIYNPAEGATSSFTLTNNSDDFVPPASDAEAEVTNADNEANANDVVVTWTASPQMDARYDIYRENDATAGFQSGQDVLVRDNATGTTATVMDELNGSHVYYVVAEGGLSGTDATPAATDSVTVPLDPTAPQSTDATVTTDASPTGVAGTGDVWRIGFSEPVTVADGDIIRVQDANGEFANVVCDTNGTGDTATANEATCAQNMSTVTVGSDTYDASELLTVTLLETLTVNGDNNANAANTGLLEYPLTIIGQAGITDAADNPWTPLDDPDNVLETTGDTSGTVTANARPLIDDAVLTTPGATAGFGNDAGDVITLSYTEAVQLAAAVVGAGQVTAAEANTILGVNTLGGAFAATASVVGETLTLTVGTAGTGPVTAGTGIPGSDTALVEDLDGLDENVNPSPTTL